MSKSLRPLAALSLAFAAITASAAPVVAPTVVDFNTLKAGKFLGKPVGSSYAEDGYSVTSWVPGDLFATAGVVDADAHGETLSSSSLTFQAQSGAAFDLLSLDLSNALNTRGGSVLLGYTVAGAATAWRWLALDNKAGLQTFALGLDDLSSFSLTSLAFQVDNITVTPYAAPAAAVPEPGSLALVLAGLGLVGTVARRRRSA